MTTYLQLCKDVVRECKLAGTGPSTVTGQSGELEDIVRYVEDAWTEIQGDRNWRWLRKRFTFNTTASDDEYAFGDITDVLSSSAITRFESWRLNDLRNPPKIYLTASGVGAQTPMIYVNFEDFESLYKVSSIQNQEGHPRHITVAPDDKIMIGPVPNDTYTITGWYNASAQILSADGDIPEMPTQYHNLIMYRAMEFYALGENAPEILVRAERGSRRIMNQLINNQNAVFKKAGPLA